MGHRCPYCRNATVRFDRLLGPTEDKQLSRATVRTVAPDDLVAMCSCSYCGNICYYRLRDDSVEPLGHPEDVPGWIAVLAMAIGVGLYIALGVFWWSCF